MRKFLSPFRRDVYLKEEGNKRLIVVGSILLGFLIIVGILGFLKERERQSREEYEVQLSRAIYDWEEAKSLLLLNPSRARVLAKTVDISAKEMLSRRIKDRLLVDLNLELTKLLPKILGEYKVEPSLLLDLTLAKEGFVTTEIAFSDNFVTLLDSSKKVVLEFSFKGKEMKLLAGESVVPGAKFVSTSANNTVFILDGQRIVSLRDGNAQTAVLSEGKWDDVAFLGEFGGNLYVVDKGKNTILRYPAISGGRFGQGTIWLKEETEVDISQAVSFAIDGSFWILTKDGDILKFREGRQERFVIQDLTDKFIDPVQLSTRESFSNLYVLDQGLGRIVVLDKKGNNKAYYNWEGLHDASGIAISEKEKKILVFKEGKVYEIELEM